MRTCKKLVALVMALAMLATMFAFSASAADVATLSITTGGTIAVGDAGYVNIVLDNATDENAAGGISGVVTVTNATLGTVEVNNNILTANNTTDVDTIIKVDGNTFKFAAVGAVSGEWFKVNLTNVQAGATVALSNVEFSNPTGSAKLTNAVVPAAYAVDVKTAADINIEEVKVKATNDATKQGLGYVVGFADDIEVSAVKEYGIIACPNSLLNSLDELVVNSSNSNVKSASISSEKFADTFASYIEEGGFNAHVDLGIDANPKALRYTGVKIAVRAYYVLSNGDVVYSNNNSETGIISNGIVNKSVINIAHGLAVISDKEKTTEFQEILDNPGTKLSDAPNFANRQTVLNWLFA